MKRRPWLILFLLLPLISALPATAAEIDWLDEGIYQTFDYTSGELKLPLNSGWRGTKELQQVSPPLFTDYPLLNSNRPEYVWGPLCRPGEQTVEFKREIFVPGVPAELAVSAGFYTYTGPAGAITNVEVAVNGQTVFKTNREVHKQKQLAGDRTAFKYGKNVVTVRADKKATGPCAIGFYTFLYAKFRADVVLKAHLPARVLPGNLPTFRITNIGPSYVPRGSTFYFKTDLYPLGFGKNVAERFPAGLIISIDGEPQSATNPRSQCQFPYGDGIGECNLGELAPGETVVVTVLWNHARKPAGDWKQEFLIEYSVTGYHDLTINNTGFKYGISCGADVPAKECKVAAR